LNKKRKFD